MRSKRIASNSSGQALIVTSLIITMLLLSTAYYVFEINKNVTDNQTAMEYNFLATRMSSRNSVVGALANISNGGELDVLTTNLNKLASAIREHSYDRECDLAFTPLNSSPYQQGIRLSWESSGLGISSAYVSFLLNVSGPSESYYSEYETNITTALTIEGVFTGSDNEKSVNATCRIYNEEGPALANDITMFHQNATNGPWIMVDSNNLNVFDYGNGTYSMFFNVYASNVLNISAHIHDSRGIFVMANTTCNIV